MKLTHASGYALAALAHMAAQAPGQPLSSHHIAEARGIPERFLLKVLKPLVSAQILHSIKGPNGGYRLAKPASEITMLDVVEAVDGPIRGAAPVNSDNPDSLLNRKLDKVCGDIADILRKQLGKVRMSELGTKD